jgi:transposase
LLVREDAAVPPEQRAYLEQVRLLCPEVSVAQQLITEFLRVVRDRDQAGLDTWLGTAQASGVVDVVEFAKGVVRDRAAWTPHWRMSGRMNRRRLKYCS